MTRDTKAVTSTDYAVGRYVVEFPRAAARRFSAAVISFSREDWPDVPNLLTAIVERDNAGNWEEIARCVWNGKVPDKRADLASHATLRLKFWKAGTTIRQGRTTPDPVPDLIPGDLRVVLDVAAPLRTAISFEVDS
jgi:hypothetical protein